MIVYEIPKNHKLYNEYIFYIGTIYKYNFIVYNSLMKIILLSMISALTMGCTATPDILQRTNSPV